MDLNATHELLRHLSVISEDETLLKKALRYLQKLVSEKEQLEEEALLSTREYEEKIQRAEAQIREGKYIKIDNPTQLSSWLENL